MKPNEPAVPLKEHIDAILHEKDRALEMAGDEREKAASALRGQQDRAEDRATEEREKSASALATSLERSIKEGDERLREHIANQVLQINRDLASAEKLEVERLAHAHDMLRSLETRIDVARQYAEKAIDKAEDASEKRFDSVNEFRKTLSDQTAGFMTRVEVEARLSALSDKVDANTNRLEKGEGRGGGIQATIGVLLGIAAIAATLAGTIVYLIIHK